MYHLIDVNDMTTEEWEELCALGDRIRAHPREFADDCRGQVLGSLFYEPSTRTNFSFSAAAQRLGGGVIGFSNPGSSSVAKGETLKDTIIMVSGYTDAIVIRSPYEGAARAASLYSSVPVINAGDGGHMHPTQTLTDLATLYHLRGRPDGMRVGLCGDLKNGRTVHTLVEALCRYDNMQFYLISPRELNLPDYTMAVLEASGHPHYETTRLESVIPMLDMLYMTRIQRERFVDPLEYERLRGVYILDRSKLRSASKELLVMHPLPRVDEIAQDVDDDPRAAYFEQAKTGMFIRMALLSTLMKKARRTPRYSLETGLRRCTNPRCITASEGYLPPLVKEKEGKLLCDYCDKPLETA